MTREIKFRAWDKKNQYMLRDSIGIYPYKASFPLTISSEGIFIRPDFEDMVLMQYTGLKDKNVKEIYEGDICKAQYSCLVTFENEPHSLIGTIEWGNDGLWLFDFGHGGTILSNEELQDMEIIGNIYENLELLE